MPLGNASKQNEPFAFVFRSRKSVASAPEASLNVAIAARIGWPASSKTSPDIEFNKSAKL